MWNALPRNLAPASSVAHDPHMSSIIAWPSSLPEDSQSTVSVPNKILQTGWFKTTESYVFTALDVSCLKASVGQAPHLLQLPGEGPSSPSSHWQTQTSLQCSGRIPTPTLSSLAPSLRLCVCMARFPVSLSSSD